LDFNFTLTGFDVVEKSKHTQCISRLGGNVTDEFLAGSTNHLVAKEPSRSEKYVCACASGVWVLKPSFLEESGRCGHWAEQAQHEWSLPARLAANTKQDTKDWMVAPGRCREIVAAMELQSVASGMCGMFKGCVVLMNTLVENSAVFKRILEAGAAKVVECSPPYRFDKKGITHAFMPRSVASAKQETLVLYAREVSKHNFLAINFDMIVQHLTKSMVINPPAKKSPSGVTHVVSSDEDEDVDEDEEIPQADEADLPKKQSSKKRKKRDK